MNPLWPRFYRGGPGRLRLVLCLTLVAPAVAVGAEALPPPVTAPAAVPLVMTRAAFASFLGRLQRKSFGDEQLGFVRASVARGDHFTCAQAGQLMRVAVTGDDQVKIAATLYPHVVDPENFAQLTLLLPLADRQALHKLIGRSEPRRE